MNSSYQNKKKVLPFNKTFVFLGVFLLFQAANAQQINPISKFKGNPISYTETIYPIVSKDNLKKNGEEIRADVFHKIFDPKALEIYEPENNIDSIVMIKNANNQILKRVNYLKKSGITGNSFNFYYNKSNQLIQVDQYYPAQNKAQTSDISQIYNYEYTKDGKIHRILMRDEITDKAYFTTEFIYKNKLLLKKIHTRFSRTPQIGPKVLEVSNDTYEYDEKGRCIKESTQEFGLIFTYKHYYNTDDTIHKTKYYISTLGPKAFGETQHTNILKSSLIEVQYPIELDDKGNATKIVIEVAEKEKTLYFLMSRTYKYE